MFVIFSHRWTVYRNLWRSQGPLVKSNMPETCRNLLQNIDFFGGSNVDIVISNLIHAQCGAVDDMNEFICLPFSPLKKTFNHGGHRFRLVRITQQKLEKSTQHHLLQVEKKHLSLKSSIAVKIKAFKRCSPYFLVYMIIIYHNHAYMLNPIQKMREDIGTLW